eukprot:6095250-Alexandrium_andersonii.AAC.1
MLAALRARFPTLAAGFPGLAVQLPPEHARRVAEGQFPTYAFPFLRGIRARSLGLRFVTALHNNQGSELPVPLRPERLAREAAGADPDFFQTLADRLREWAPAVLRNHPGVGPDLRDSVSRLQQMHDAA